MIMQLIDWPYILNDTVHAHAFLDVVRCFSRSLLSTCFLPVEIY
jgi:hypothetical protein